MRLDFVSFVISGPSLFSSPYGYCSSDRLAIFGSGQQNLGLSEGNLICGDMTGQHSKFYIFKNLPRDPRKISTKIEA